jgi:hypothetical protein
LRFATASRGVTRPNSARELKKASVVNIEETGWKTAGDNRTLWGALTSQSAVFRIAAGRHGFEARTLLGERFAGIVCSDRWRGYDYLDPSRRQLCWAHLLRDFTAHSEGMAEQKTFGDDGVRIARDLFAAWQAYQADGDRARLQAQIAPLQPKLRALLEHAARKSPRTKYHRLFAKSLLIDGTVNLVIPLIDAFGNPGLLEQVGEDRVLQSLGEEREYKNDEQMDNSMRSVLFEVPKPNGKNPPNCGEPVILPSCFTDVSDLAADDIQRGRDHGMPSYNALRRAYGLAPVGSFTQITGESTDRFPTNDPKIDPTDRSTIRTASISSSCRTRRGPSSRSEATTPRRTRSPACAGRRWPPVCGRSTATSTRSTRSSAWSRRSTCRARSSGPCSSRSGKSSSRRCATAIACSMSTIRL